MADEAQGSLYTLSSSSYSGADIKIVVNLPTADLSVNQQIININQDIDGLQKDAINLQKNIDELEYNLLSYKQSTPEYMEANKLHSKLVSSLMQVEDKIQTNMLRTSTLAQIAPQSTTKVLAEVQTISISTYRNKQPVRSCGSVYPKGYTRGGRDIAGSMVFTVFDEHVLYQLLAVHPSDFDGVVGNTSALLDQLPPIDLTIVFANEYGKTSRMALYGVEFVDEGMTMSIEDIITENVVSYVARDLDPLRGVSEYKLDEVSRRFSQERLKKASSLIFEEDYKDYKNYNDPWGRFYNRRNPYM